MISHDNSSNNEEEFHNLQQFNHPNIIEGLEYKNEFLQDYLVIQYMDYGDLLSFLSNYKSKLLKKNFVQNRETFETFWKTIFIQIVDALIYMKSLGWAHLDLKPENILINSNFDVKLIDFEYACCCRSVNEEMNKIHLVGKRCGTLNYFSPEIKEGNLPYDPFQSDVFSLGVTFNNLLGGYDLFPTPKTCVAREKNYMNMKEGKFGKIWRRMGERTLCKFFSEEFKELIEKMLSYDPKKRISIEEVRENQWFCQELYTKDQMKNLFTNL